MRKFISFAVLPLVLNPGIVSACAVCLTGPGDPAADAYNWSVIFLMATPYAVMGSIAGVLFYRYRRSVIKRAPDEATPPALHIAWSQKESER